MYPNMIDNLQTAKDFGFMRLLRSVNLVLQDSFPWDSPLSQLEILQGQPVQYTTIRWAHSLNVLHCPKHSRLLPGAGSSERTFLLRQDWGSLDGFFKCRYSSSYQMPFPLVLLLQWRRPETSAVGEWFGLRESLLAFWRLKGGAFPTGWDKCLSYFNQLLIDFYCGYQF